MKTLARRGAPLSDTRHQLDLLNSSAGVASLAKFGAKLSELGLFPLKPTRLETLQVNLGKMCNQTCTHCHVDAGPDRTEIMTRETMAWCLRALEQSEIRTVDLTGGAPEMNPDFRWFVESITRLGRKTIVRCNLTILLAGEKYADLPEFFAAHRVHVISSLPCYEKKNTDLQRGIGVFDKSIQALLRLNRVGYGIPDSDLKLDLVYNPVGAFLAADQKALEDKFKFELRRLFDVRFNELLAINNLPVSRFLEFLVESGNLDEYMTQLVQAFNPRAASNVMCRSLVSVGWDGTLYDCDFNQMLEMPLVSSAPRHIQDFDVPKLNRRTIAVNQHCYGCTAAQGSSCGGQTV